MGYASECKFCKLFVCNVLWLQPRNRLTLETSSREDTEVSR